MKHSHWPKSIGSPAEGAKQACTSTHTQKGLSPFQAVRVKHDSQSSRLSEFRAEITVKLGHEDVMGKEERWEGVWAWELQEYVRLGAEGIGEQATSVGRWLIGKGA